MSVIRKQQKRGHISTVQLIWIKKLGMKLPDSLVSLHWHE
jgi:hypothetical protein